MTEDPGSTSVDIAVVARDPRWRSVAPGAEALARRAAEAVFRHLAGCSDLGRPGLGGPLETAVVLADDALLRDLNRTYRGQDRPTNVLSFGDSEAMKVPGEVPGGPKLLGDVVLARETLVREAAEQGKPLDHHLTHLVVHGVLHLLGYDHDAEPRAGEMETLEVAILADLGIADPYAGDPHAGDLCGAGGRGREGAT